MIRAHAAAERSIKNATVNKIISLLCYGVAEDINDAYDYDRMKSIPSDKKFNSKKEWEAHVWSKLVNGFVETNSAQEVAGALDMLLTAHEKKQMINRASAISLLKQGMSYSEIGKILWLSPTTISAIKKSIREQAGYISRYARNKKSEIKQKPLTKEEWKQLKFSLWMESFFTLPYPPLRHPRLMRALGLDDKFPLKRQR